MVRAGRREEREVTALPPRRGGLPAAPRRGRHPRGGGRAHARRGARRCATSLPPLEPGEYYVEDVLGCAVEDEAGRALGVAVGTFWNGAHDVVTVVDRRGTEQRATLIPLVPDFVLTVDARGRKIRVRWDDDA